MKKTALLLLIVALIIPFTMASSKFKGESNILKEYPIDNLDSIITRSGISIDKNISSDGKASLKIEAKEPVVVRLFETGDINIENATLLYKAKIKTENFKGQAYLEMWCHFDDKGSFFSRDLASPVEGDVSWVTEETPFYLKKGENPDNVSLNIVINGTGTVWVDDVELLKAKLPEQ